jgi:hypothetical protein
MLAVTVTFAAALIACSGEGEDRPGSVEVIGGEGSVSVSGAVEGYGEQLYFPASDQSLNLAIGADLQDMRSLMSAAARGDAVDWAAVTALYEGGKNQKRADGSVRSTASLAKDRPAGFAGAQAGLADGVIRAGLAGSGRGAGVSDNARRQLVDKGIQDLMYTLALERLSAAEKAFASGSTVTVTNIDEAWATLSGARDATTGSPNSGLLATGISREEDFGFQGRLSRPLESALLATAAAAERKDGAAFQRELANSRGYLNTIMYLSVLRYGPTLESDQRASDREFHLAEGWAYWKGLEPVVRPATGGGANAIEEAYTRPPEEEFPRSETDQIFGAMNDPTVLSTLNVPTEFRVRAPKP